MKKNRLLRWVEVIRYACAVGLGYLMLTVRYSHAERVELSGRSVIRRQRRWFSVPVILAGNAYLRLAGIGTEVLSYRQWCRREQSMYRVLYGETSVFDQAGAVVVPVFPGFSLAEYLGSEEIGDRRKLDAVGIAAASLKAMHERYETGFATKRRPVSHGDASASNVIFDPNTGSARWIDFDMAHSDQMSSVRRHADDLRTLIYSVVRYIPEALIAELLSTLFKHYADEDVLSECYIVIQQQCRHPNASHIAQAGFSREIRKRVDVEVLRCLAQLSGNCQ